MTTTFNPPPRILLVDDESAVLDGLQTYLGRAFDITTATRGEAGLEALQSGSPFEVVMSDMRMPGMTGIEFLEKARAISPRTTRLLLTGWADVDTTVAAVNQGGVFRVIMKPAMPDVITEALQAAASAFRASAPTPVAAPVAGDGDAGLALAGGVRALLKMLASAQPQAAARAGRVRQLVRPLCERLGGDAGQVEIAAQLSQLGTLSLPAPLVSKLFEGRPLSDEEQAAVDNVPALSAQGLEDMPRLEEVRTILSHVSDRFVADDEDRRRPEGERIPWGARVLKVVLDFDRLTSQRLAGPDAISVLRVRRGWYDPAILSEFALMLGEFDPVRRPTFVRAGMLPKRLVVCQIPPSLHDHPAPTGSLMVLSLDDMRRAVQADSIEGPQPTVAYVRAQDLAVHLGDTEGGRPDNLARRRAGVRQTRIEALEPGMVVADDVMCGGELLLARGCEVTAELLQAVLAATGVNPTLPVLVVERL